MVEPLLKTTMIQQQQQHTIGFWHQSNSILLLSIGRKVPIIELWLYCKHNTYKIVWQFGSYFISLDFLWLREFPANKVRGLKYFIFFLIWWNLSASWMFIIESNCKEDGERHNMNLSRLKEIQKICLTSMSQEKHNITHTSWWKL